MTAYAYIQKLNTPSQIWARKHSACFSGRARLGKRSIVQFWQEARTRQDASDLYWIAVRLGRDCLTGDTHSYDHALSAAYGRSYYGSKRGPKCGRIKRELLAVMVAFKITIPAELL